MDLGLATQLGLRPRAIPGKAATPGLAMWICSRLWPRWTGLADQSLLWVKREDTSDFFGFAFCRFTGSTSSTSTGRARLPLRTRL